MGVMAVEVVCGKVSRVDVRVISVVGCTSSTICI